MSPAADRRGDAVRIADIIEAAIRLESTRERGYDRFRADRDALDATVRRREFIGEAAGKVSGPTRDRYPAVPWWKMRGLASFAKHEHWKIKPAEVWNAIEAMSNIRRVLSEARGE